MYTCMYNCQLVTKHENKGESDRYVLVPEAIEGYSGWLDMLTTSVEFLCYYCYQ